MIFYATWNYLPKYCIALAVIPNKLIVVVFESNNVSDLRLGLGYVINGSGQNDFFLYIIKSIALGVRVKTGGSPRL